MQFEHFLLLILAILPFIYKYSFWLYTIQLKEYRWDRLKEYLSTKQWKSAIFNMWFFLELPLLIGSFVIFYDKNFEIIIFPIIFYFMITYNVFVLWKVIRKNLLKPKLTSRLLLIVAFFILWLSLDLYFLVFKEQIIFIYSYILSGLLLAPMIIFFYIILTLPIVDFLKNKKIKSAILKSKKTNKPIKVWITGSYWKSSVKEYLSQILEQEGSTLKTPENINTELWVSAIILNKLKNKYKYFVAEMWAYKIWEISILWKIVNQKYWFLTAIWNQHIWLFGNQENIKIGKSEIQESVLKNDGILYINWDNENIRKTKFDKKLNLIKYWKNIKSDAKFNIIWIKKWKTEFEFEYKKIKEKFETNLIWEHNIINLTWILAFCYDIWFKIKDLKKHLLNIKKPKNTQEIIEHGGNILIDDTYNLSEAWLNSGLELLEYFEKKDKILILDDILELGKQAKNIHYELWKKIAKNKLVGKVLYIWINYKESFVKWLLEWWFKNENILKIEEFSSLNKSVILFEWRNAKKYLDKLNK